MKKIIPFVLACALLFSMSTTAAASESGNLEALDQSILQTLISQALSDIEPDKESAGLERVNFQELKIGAPISAYNLCIDGPIFSRYVYPLFQNEELVALGFQAEVDGSSYIQLTTSLVDSINEQLENSTDFALIYDNTSCYLYNGSQFSLIAHSELTDSSRISLSDSPLSANLSSISLTAIAPQMQLDYSTVPSTYSTPSYYSCPVSFVSQMPYENICWAATIACISNYINDTNYDAPTIAKMLYGSSNFNKPATTPEAARVFNNSEINLAYSFCSYVDDNIILNNIRGDFPLYALFTRSSGGHVLTIYGVNVLSGYISIMCPINGQLTAYSSSKGYQYVSPSSNSTFTLLNVACFST